MIDLHAHYPMHLHRGPHAGIQMRRWEAEKWRMRLVNRVSKHRNYEGPGDTPDVTMDLILKGGLAVVLSVLYWPYDEITPKVKFGKKPSPKAPYSLLDQMDLVEDEVRYRHGGDAIVVKSRSGLEQALKNRLAAVVHCVEGGFALGATEKEIDETVATLHTRGVAYVTLAHLFFRDVATNAPALPFLPDWAYHVLFRQPRKGLTELGVAAANAMMNEKVVIDVTHMSKRSLDQTLTLAESRYMPGDVPVIASHGAYRFPGYPEYNLDDQSIVRIAKLGGVIGLICCAHYMAFREDPQPANLKDSVETMCRHIDKIVAILRKAPEIADPYAHIAIGSDLDGYIKPALAGLKTIDTMRFLERELAEKYPEHAAKICNENALRMLRYRFPEAEADPAGSTVGSRSDNGRRLRRARRPRGEPRATITAAAKVILTLGGMLAYRRWGLPGWLTTRPGILDGSGR